MKDFYFSFFVSIIIHIFIFAVAFQKQKQENQRKVVWISFAQKIVEEKPKMGEKMEEREKEDVKKREEDMKKEEVKEGERGKNVERGGNMRVGKKEKSKERLEGEKIRTMGKKEGKGGIVKKSREVRGIKGEVHKRRIADTKGGIEWKKEEILKKFSEIMREYEEGDFDYYKVEEGEELPDEIGNYVEEFFRIVKESWIVPPPFSGKDMSAVIVVKIDREGNIVDIFVEKSSGNKSFDDLAIKALKRKFPPPPIPLQIGVRFRS